MSRTKRVDAIPLVRWRVRIGARRYECDMTHWHCQPLPNARRFGLTGRISAWALQPDDYLEHATELRRRLTVAPDDVMTRFLLGNGLRMAGLVGEARDEYEIVAAYGESHWAYAARQLLQEEKNGGFRYRGPCETWGQVWGWGFNRIFAIRFWH